MEKSTFERKQNLLRNGVSLGIAMVFLGILVTSTWAASEGSSCVSCHTNSRELIKLTQIILKERPPVKSEQIKGEG